MPNELQQLKVTPGVLNPGEDFTEVFHMPQEDRVLRALRVPADVPGSFDFFLHADEAKTKPVLDHGACTDAIFWQRYDIPLHSVGGVLVFTLSNTGSVVQTFSEVEITLEVMK